MDQSDYARMPKDLGRFGISPTIVCLKPEFFLSSPTEAHQPPKIYFILPNFGKNFRELCQSWKQAITVQNFDILGWQNWIHSPSNPTNPIVDMNPYQFRRTLTFILLSNVVSKCQIPEKIEKAQNLDKCVFTLKFWLKLNVCNLHWSNIMTKLELS